MKGQIDEILCNKLVFHLLEYWKPSLKIEIWEVIVLLGRLIYIRYQSRLKKMRNTIHSYLLRKIETIVTSFVVIVFFCFFFSHVQKIAKI